MQEDLSKLKYHVKLLAECLPISDDSYCVSLSNGIGDLLISKGLDDIFEKYDKELDKGGSLNASKLEHDLRSEFGIGYQEVKGIVVTFWRGGQWQPVCKQYAEQNECHEFHVILDR